METKTEANINDFGPLVESMKEFGEQLEKKAAEQLPNGDKGEIMNEAKAFIKKNRESIITGYEAIQSGGRISARLKETDRAGRNVFTVTIRHGVGLVGRQIFNVIEG